MKKMLASFLAISLFLAGNILCASPSRDNTRLQQDYADFNSAFFNGQLPPGVRISWTDIPLKNGNYVMGKTNENLIDGNFTIDIDTKSNIAMNTAETTLLHEMCHVKSMDYALSHNQNEHGLAFKSCLVDLELQGAFTDLL